MALDTGALSRPLVAAAPTRVEVGSLAGVSPGTTGVLVRVVARRSSTAGHLTLHRCGASSGTAASLSFSPGNLAATVAVAPVQGGAFCVTASAGVDVRIAVVAQQAATGVGMLPVGARRALDAPLAAGTSQSLTPAQLGVSSTAKAVTVTVSLLAPAGDGGFGIGACGGTPWIVSFAKAASQTFSAVVRTNAAGVCISSSVDVHVVIDVTGAWTGSAAMRATAPSRLFDSASNSIGVAPTTVRLAVPGAAAGAQLQISLRSGSKATSLTVWNCADHRPNGAVVYAAANTWMTVSAGMKTSGGSVCMSASSPARVVVDLAAAG
jgi:hypothetical protein